MALSAECRALVEKQPEVEAPDFAGLEGEGAVAYVDSLRAAFPVVPEKLDDAVEIADVIIDVGDRTLDLRIYRPHSERDLPPAAFFHGGGWVAGTPRAYDQICSRIAASTPCVIASVAYRLAPEHRFPAAFEDACDAIAWLAAEARELGADPDRLSVLGLSAGGNLAAAAALHARDTGGPGLLRQVLVYPVTDQAMASESHREMGEGYVTTHAQIGFFWRQYAPDAELRLSPYASPLGSADLGRLPRALVFGAEFDPLCGDGEAYADALRAAGGDAEFELCLGQIHGFLSLFPDSPTSRRVIDRIASELATAA